MGETEDQVNDATLRSPEILTILKEFYNIANLVRDEELLETVPKAKLRRIKWVLMFNCLKQGIYDEMVQELTSMWEFENIPEKLEVLQEQKEKFSKINPDNIAWRPHYNIKNHLRAFDVANLRKQKVLLESLAKEYEVSKLKNTVTGKRSYLKALQIDIEKYQTKNEEIVTQIADGIKNHSRLVDLIEPNKINIEDINWARKKLDV